MIQLSSLMGTAFGTETTGGIQLQYSGPESGVVAYAGITDETVGFSESPRLIENHLDPARPVHQVTLSAPGLLLGNADPSMEFPSGTYFKPYAVMQNLSAQSRQISLSLTSSPVGGTPQDISLGNRDPGAWPDNPVRSRVTIHTVQSIAKRLRPSRCNLSGAGWRYPHGNRKRRSIGLLRFRGHAHHSGRFGQPHHLLLVS